MQTLYRAGTVAAATASVLALSATSALAHQCVNANKPAGAGAQVIVNEQTGSITFANAGAARRAEKGLIGEETFRGLFGIDFDGDGKADLTTYIVGKYGEIPEAAQKAGAECNGIVNIEAYFACFMEEM